MGCPTTRAAVLAIPVTVFCPIVVVPVNVGEFGGP